MPTDLVTLEGPATITDPPEGYTPTGFTFDATLTDAGLYDTVASGTGTEIARLPDSVEGLLATIISVTPPTNSSDVVQTYVALGTNLADTDEVAWEGPETGTVAPVSGSVTATGFEFDATLGTDGEYAVIAKCQGNEIARLEIAITITTVVTVTDVTPEVVYVTELNTITVTGTGLQDVDQVLIEGPETFTFAPVGLTSTSFTVDLTTTQEGLFNLALYTGGAMVYQEDNVILSIDSNVRITNVTPDRVLDTVVTTYTATGLNFVTGAVDQVELVGKFSGQLATVTATVVSETELTFDAELDGLNIYDVNLLAAGSTVASEPEAIQVAAPDGVITAIDPPEWLENDERVYTVTGTGLSAAATVLLQDSTGAAGVLVRIFGRSDTGFRFQTSLDVEVYDVIAYDPLDFVTGRLDDGLTIVPIGTPIPLTVTPNFLPGQVPTVYTVTGTDLLVVASVNLEGRGAAGTLQNARVADKTSTGFTFARNLPAPDVYNLVLLDSAGTEVGRLDSAIATIDRPPAVITRVVPKLVANGVATEILVYGTNLLRTDLVRLTGVGGTVDVTPTDVTAVKITLTATIPTDGPYDVILMAGPEEIAHENRAVLVSSTPLFFRITPDTVPDDTATTYLVEGICLGQILSCSLIDPNGVGTVVDLVPTPITEHGNTEYSFTIDATLAEIGVYTLQGFPTATSTPGTHTAELVDAVTVTTVTVPTGMITNVTPPFVTRAVATEVTVTGSGLAAVDSVRLEGMGQALNVAVSGVTDTSFTLIANLPIGGQYDLVALAAGIEIAREDDALRAVVTATLVAADPLHVAADTQTTFHVLGTGLGQADHITLAGGVTPVITNLPITKLDDFGTQEYRFDFDYALPGPDNFAIYVYDATNPNPIASAQHVFYVDAAPLTIDITSVTPQVRPERTATTYTVVGTLLSTVDEANLVPTGGGTAIPVTIVGLTDTGFTFDQTLNDVGEYDLVLSTAGSEVTREDVAITVIARPIPDVINLMPNPSLVNVANDYAAGGTQLGAVDGAYATPSAGGTALPLPIESVTETLIKFDPYTFTATGVYDLTVTEGGVDADNYQDAFTIQATFATNLLSVTPDTGASGDSVDVTITYTGQDMTTVLLQPVGGVGPRIDTTGTVTVPGSTLTATLDLTGLPAGEYDLGLAPTGNDFRTNVLRFTITDAPPPPTPVINTVTPNTAADNTATTYTAAGDDLADTVTVELYTVVGTQASFPITPTSITATEIVFDATLTPAGTYSIRALDVNGTALATLLDAVEITAVVLPGTITAVTPSPNPTGTSTVYHVTGTGLATVVGYGFAFDSVPSNQRTAVNVTDTGFDTSTETLNTIGLWDVAAFAAGSVRVAQGDDLLEITAAPVPPTITSVSPTTAPFDTGTTYTVTGTDLAAVTGCAFYDSTGTLWTVPMSTTAETDTSFNVTASIDVAGVYAIAAEVAGVEVARLDAAITIDAAVAVADVTSIIPAVGEAGSTVTFTVTGTGFTDVTQVELEGPKP